MSQRPNILFITSHDLGQHLGCYGQSSVCTPALDDFAASGVRFENSFCTAPQCSPSRAALHTGLYPHSAGVLGLSHPPFNWRIQPGIHLVDILKLQGYATALAGIQHVTPHVSDLSYDRILPLRSAPELAYSVVPLLKELPTPFYLEVGFFEPHRPYEWMGNQPDHSKGVVIPAYLPESDEVYKEFALLQGMIHRLDEGVGIILEALNQSGLADATWVIFAADHGLAMPRAKCTLYDPGLSVALLMRWSGAGIHGGRIIQPMVSNVDVVPSMMEGLGLEIPARMQGRSFWSLLHGESCQVRSAVYAEKTFHTSYEPMRAIRTQKHKLILNLEISTQVDVPTDIRRSPLYPLMHEALDGHRVLVELYDLDSDPLEKHNLAGDLHWADTETELRRELLLWMEETQDPLLSGPVSSPYYHQALAWLRGAAD
jgi:N-sulfoglucosamine sulfohydrolase